MSQFRFVVLIILVPLLTIGAINNLASISSDDLWHYLILGLLFAAFAIAALVVVVREIQRRRAAGTVG